MSAVSANSLLPQLADALGLDPTRLRGITLEASTDSVVTASVNQYIDGEQLNRIIQCFSFGDYVLVPKRCALKWHSIAEKLPPQDERVLYNSRIDDEFPHMSNVGYWLGGWTDGREAIVMQPDDDPKNWYPCTHWAYLPDPE